MAERTGRQIAIFTDAHGLLEPTEAALEDIASRGITEIYSLGDNIGEGPNSGEVLDLLDKYKVKSIAGNSEDYVTLGTVPFWYLDATRKASNVWTISKLNEKQIGKIKLFPHSIELLVGGKKLGLVHFANDVRIDFGFRDSWSYQANIGNKAYEQFDYTNSDAQFDEIEEMIAKYGKDSPLVTGYLSAKDEPILRKKRVDQFDAIIQGHVHWKLYDKSNTTEFYSIRAVGMAYANDPVDTASYVILHETDEGFELEEVLVKYDREKMISSILSSKNPDNRIKKFVSM